jgi:uncharacterized YigZ family protein
MAKIKQLIPAEITRAEIRVVNSRFVATIGPVFSVEEARAFVDQIKTEFADATHNVPAYVIGHGSSLTAHCNDDGEPSGTAGRPALVILQGSGLGDVAVVITRYFGGSKLGTGGLVRAYGDAVRAVLAVTPRAEKVNTYTIVMNVPYNLLERLRLLVKAYNGRILNEDFAADVTITAQLRMEQYTQYQSGLRDLSKGQSEARIVQKNEATIIPVMDKFHSD